MCAVSASEYLQDVAVPDAPYVLRFQLTLDDYKTAAKHHPARKRIRRMLWVIATLLIVLGLFELSSDAGVAVILMAAGVFFPLFLKYAINSGVRKNFDSMKSILAEPVEMSYGPGFITYKSTRTFSYTVWIYQFICSKDMRLLGLSNQSYWIVPTRLFETPLALAEFDQIVGELAEKR